MTNKSNRANRNSQKRNGSKAKSSYRGSRTYDPTHKDTDANRSASTNDPSWYSQNESLLRDAASIPYSWALGTKLPLNSNYLVEDMEQSDIISIPGVQSINLLHTIGNNDMKSDPVNIASLQIYAYVRHANSGHSNYDAPDLMLYLLAMADIYSYITFLQRVYGVANLYSQRNRYMNETLLKTMRMDSNDVVHNLANFRYGLNMLINKAASFAVPANMPFYNRRAYLYSSIFIEGESVKDQMYLYNPQGFYEFAWNDTSSAGELQFRPWNTTDSVTGDFKMHTVKEALDYGETLVNTILKSEDLNIMSGDILKAYGDGGIIKLSAFPADFFTVPIRDIAALEQMKNTTILTSLQNGWEVDPTSLTIKHSSDKGYLISAPVVQLSATTTLGDSDTIKGKKADSMKMLLANNILTTEAAEPTAALTMENTRCMVAGKLKSGTGTSAKYSVFCGTEVAHSVDFWYFTQQFNPTTSTLDWVPTSNDAAFVSIVDSTTDLEWTNTLTVLGKLSCFKYHPCLHYIYITDTGSVWTGPIFDIDNYALITPDDLNRMHEAALMNLLNVPSIAKL